MANSWLPEGILGSELAPHPRQRRFEAQRVQMVLRALNRADLIPEKHSAGLGNWGEKGITFEKFYDFFPFFPITLEAQSLFGTSPNKHWATIKSWLTQFDSTFVFQRFMQVVLNYRHPNSPSYCPWYVLAHADFPFGMIFPWNGVHGGLILHNAKSPAPLPRFTVNYLDSEGYRHRLTVECFKPWLNVLSRFVSTHSAQDSFRASPRSAPARQKAVWRGAAVRPWMVQLCGPRDGYLLSWLRRITGYSTRWQFEHRFRSSGIGGVLLSYRELAQHTGLDEQQARRAVASLTKREFIKVETQKTPSGRATFIEVEWSAIGEARKRIAAQT